MRSQYAVWYARLKIFQQSSIRLGFIENLIVCRADKKSDCSFTINFANHMLNNSEIIGRLILATSSIEVCTLVAM